MKYFTYWVNKTTDILGMDSSTFERNICLTLRAGFFASVSNVLIYLWHHIMTSSLKLALLSLESTTKRLECNISCSNCHENSSVTDFAKLNLNQFLVFFAIWKVCLLQTSHYFVETGYNVWSTDDINWKLMPVIDTNFSYKLV